MFYIATYHSHGESQTALKSIITAADQLIPMIPYIVMLFLENLYMEMLSTVLNRPGTHHTWVR